VTDSAGSWSPTPGQSRLMFSERLRRHPSDYYLSFAWRISGGLDPDILSSAVDAVVDRHDAMRTIVVSHSGILWCCLTASDGGRLHVEDMNLVDRGAVDERLLAFTTSPFDLEREPGWRFLLLRGDALEHVFCVVAHHMFCDGHSMAVFLRHLSVCYHRITEGKPLGLTAAPASAEVGRAVLQKEQASIETDLLFWRSELDGLVSPPSDQRSGVSLVPPRQGFEIVPLKSGSAGLVIRLVSSVRVTPFATILSVFVLTYQLRAGTRDELFGIPFSLRADDRALSDAVGFYVNTLPLRVDLDRPGSFREFAQHVQSSVTSAIAHGGLDFGKIVRSACAEYTSFRAQPIQVGFDMEDPSWRRLGLVGVVCDELDFPFRPAPFDVVGSFRWGDESFSGHIAFDAGRVEAGFVRGFGDAFVSVLEAVAADPDIGLGRLRELSVSAAERAEVERYGRGVRLAGGDRCVHELVLEHASAAPKAVAVVGPDGESLTYAELVRRARQLARVLSERGVGRGSVVPVLVGRGFGWPVALLGVWFAGAAYLPLDVQYPRDRLEFILGDVGAAVAIVDAASESMLRLSSCDAVRVDRLEELDGAELGDWEPLDARFDSAAYLIYTSGSTGTPKGVVIEHGALSNLVAWHNAEYEIGVGDRGTLIAGFGFDAGVWELWPYLAAGASVAICDEKTRLSPPTLLQWLRTAEVSHAFLPTPLAEAVLKLVGVEELDLRVLLTGGDRLTTRAPNGCRFRLMNHYGPTESAVVTTVADVSATDGPGMPPIGRPIANIYVRVLGPSLELLPAGTVGELYIGGAGLARGYWNREDLTAERFIIDPHDSVHGTRLYRTGDLVRWDNDGQLEFVGRSDHQVKVRGYRIELGEIESVLCAMPEVSTAVVVARDDMPGGRQLVAYAVPVTGGQITEWRPHAQAKLPDYMVPTTLVQLPALPLTRNGKVDRGALPLPTADVTDEYVAPRTEIEQTLANVWSAAFALPRVSIHDNFFELGGDSMLAMEIAAQAEEVLGCRVPLGLIYETQTIGGLAASLDERGT